MILALYHYDDEAEYSNIDAISLAGNRADLTALIPTDYIADWDSYHHKDADGYHNGDDAPDDNIPTDYYKLVEANLATLTDPADDLQAVHYLVFVDDDGDDITIRGISPSGNIDKLVALIPDGYGTYKSGHYYDDYGDSYYFIVDSDYVPHIS